VRNALNAPRKDVELPISDFPNIACETFDKITIVNHNQNRPFISRQSLLETNPGGEIKVVDWLVQQKKITSAGDQASER
jgi:hypothetical protein